MVLARSLYRFGTPASRLLASRLSSSVQLAAQGARIGAWKAQRDLGQKRWLTENREKVKVLAVLYDGMLSKWSCRGTKLINCRRKGCRGVSRASRLVYVESLSSTATTA